MNHFSQSGFLQLTPAVFSLLKPGKINNLNLKVSQVKCQICAHIKDI